MSVIFTIPILVLLIVKGRVVAVNRRQIAELIVQSVNDNETTMWKAVPSRFDIWSNVAVEGMLGVSPLTMRSKMETAKRLRRVDKLRVTSQWKSPAWRRLRQFGQASLPKQFDPREKWPECASTLNEIRDQGSCGSCWAFGAVEAMSDRLCIHSNGVEMAHLSAQDLVACCDSCGFGCFGGYPDSAWQYWIRKGIVTGGNYNSSEGCVPYSIPACEHHRDGSRPPCGDIVSTPKCHKRCTGAGAGSDDATAYEQDRHFGEGTVGTSCFEEEIMHELYENGPVEAAMLVYEDFLNYGEGIYHHVTGSLLGGHAVKLLGWGESGDDQRYWLAANSWNTDWGEDGFFRIRRGHDECGFESDIVFARPKIQGMAVRTAHSSMDRIRSVMFSSIAARRMLIHQLVMMRYMMLLLPILILIVMYRGLVSRNRRAALDGSKVVVVDEMKDSSAYVNKKGYMRIQ